MCLITVLPCFVRTGTDHVVSGQGANAMAMLADSVEVVIGVDTHKQTHTAAVVATATGHTTVTMTVPATPTATGSS